MRRYSKRNTSRCSNEPGASSESTPTLVERTRSELGARRHWLYLLRDVLRPRTEHFDRVWAVGLLSLIAVSWRLWIPRGDALEIPLVDGVSSLRDFLLWTPLLGITLPVIAILFTGRRWLWWIVAISLVVAFLINQHRLQPWAYQTAIYAPVFASMDREQVRKWLRPLAASIYVYSAVGKFDYQFAHTVGQQFLETIMSVVGGVPESWSEPTRAKLAMLFPAGELIVGLGLLVPHTRRVAGWLVIAFHLTLLLVLGPWGLDHSHGVLVWNVVLLAQGVLFVCFAGSRVCTRKGTRARCRFTGLNHCKNDGPDRAGRAAR